MRHYLRTYIITLVESITYILYIYATYLIMLYTVQVILNAHICNYTAIRFNMIQFYFTRIHANV